MELLSLLDDDQLAGVAVVAALCGALVAVTGPMVAAPVIAPFARPCWSRHGSQAERHGLALHMRACETKKELLETKQKLNAAKKELVLHQPCALVLGETKRMAKGADVIIKWPRCI